MYIFRKLQLLLVSTFMVFNCIGLSQELSFSHYGLEEGISQGSVMVILKDSDGFVWIGTQDGLNRFDGNSFKIYKRNEKKPQSISGNFINALLEDRDKIWVATAANGLCYYDKNRDVFIQVGNRYSSCNNLAKDDMGNLYASFLDEGYSVFTAENDSIVERKVKLPNSSNGNITSLFVAQNNNLLIGTKNGDLFSVNKETTEIILRGDNKGSINRITEINKQLWLSTSHGLVVFNPTENTAKKITVDHEFEVGNSLVVNSVLFDQNTYYIATDNGLYITSSFSANEFGIVSHLKGDVNNKRSITSNRVYDLFLDDQLLFIGTNKLDILSLEDPVFKVYNTKSKIKLNNSFVFSIFKTHKYTFVGTRNGLNCIDSQGKVTVITKENTNGKLAYNVIRGIVVDKFNNLWLATTKGVSVIRLHDFDPENPDILSTYSDPNADPDLSLSLSHNNTRNVFVDRQNRVWISTYGGGICLFTGDIAYNNFTFKQFRQDDNPSSSLSTDFVFNMTQDERGSYWIATNNGLNKLTYSEEGGAVFEVFNRQNSSLNVTSILTTYQDEKNNLLWIGSNLGLIKYNYTTNKFLQYGEDDGLTNNVIYSILEDQNNDLWMSTNTGLFRFDRKTETFTNFDQKDGLHSSEFNLGALFKDDEILYFGGVNGASYFNPEDINNLYYEGDLVFTSLTIKDKEIAPFNSKILSTNITQATTIHLNYNDFPTYLKFSELNFNLAKNGEFMYRLLSNDEEWNTLSNRKEIQLLNLSPGTYKLQVTGKTNNQLWQKEPLEIVIEVTPAWYKSNWAFLFYGLLLGGLVVLIYRAQIQKKINKHELLRLQEIAKKNKIIKKTLAEKEVLFKEVHHRVKNNLQVISSILSLQERYLTNPKAITAIQDSQHRIEAISLIHQKLYTDESITAIRIKDYIDDLAFSVISSMESDDNKIEFDSSIENLLLEVDTVTPIGLIFNELLLNSIKHNSTMEEVKLEVTLLKKEDVLVFKIKDNGKGVSVDFDYRKTNSYGMKMIESLSRKLKADVEFINSKGLEVTLVIRKFKEIKEQASE